MINLYITIQFQFLGQEGGGLATCAYTYIYIYIYMCVCVSVDTSPKTPPSLIGNESRLIG